MVRQPDSSRPERSDRSVGVKLPRGSGGATGRARASVWTAREVRTFLEHVQRDRLAALYRLAATTGMRRGELLGLTWRALDLEGGRLAVEQAVVPTRGGLTFAEPKTDRGKRRIALDEDTIASLRHHRATQLIEQALMADGYADHDLVFCNEDGTPFNPKRLTESFRAHVTAAGLPRIRLHDLRHTHATLALVGGVPVHVVSARLGHSSPAITMNVYAHLLPTSDESAAERVAELIDG